MAKEKKTTALIIVMSIPLFGKCMIGFLNECIKNLLEKSSTYYEYLVLILSTK